MSTFISYELPVKLLTETAKLPDKANLFDGGLDLYNDEKEVITLAPGQRRKFSFGISMAIPKGFVGTIWPRSGLADKEGLDRLAGVIDSTFRGEVKAILINHSDEYQVYKPGDKIAQMLITYSPNFTPVAKDSLDETSRGENGFGSSGR